MSTRDLLRAHTADLVRPRWASYQDAIAHLVTTVHDLDASDDQSEQAALAFLDHWGSHPVYRKTARYGLILHVMRDRLDPADVRPAEFDAHVQRLRYADTADWYRAYTTKTGPRPDGALTRLGQMMSDPDTRELLRWETR